jgi:hypothetical protein
LLSFVEDVEIDRGEEYGGVGKIKGGLTVPREGNIASSMSW